MALNSQYILASDLESFFIDKDTGLPLAGGIISCYEDSARTVLKPIYQLVGNYPSYSYAALPNPLTLSAVGTVQDSGGNNVDIYWYPYDSQGNLDLYYVTVTNSAGTMQLTRGAWPNTTEAENPITQQILLENQISNPTFTNVFLNLGNQGITNVFSVTSATAQVFVVGPDWNMVISGTGTVTVQQKPIAGDTNVPTSPPYVLDVLVGEGITQCWLQQTFATNSGLWATTGAKNIFLSGSFVAQNMISGTTGLQMFYLESGGTNPAVQIVNATTIAQPFSLFQGTTANPIPPSVNANTGASGFVTIYLAFAASTHIQVSSIQVVPIAGDAGAIVAPDLSSSNRFEAYQGDWYIPRVAAKQINSFLVGWDFTTNPYQFGSSGTITTTAGYICDQTIACCDSNGNITWSLDNNTRGIQFATITSPATTASFYLMQYLQGAQVKNITFENLSVNNTVNGGGHVWTIYNYLYRASTAALFPTLPTSIGTVTSSGTFSLTAAGWSEIPRNGLPDAQVSVIQTNTINDYGFNNWQITDPAAIADTDKFAIVTTFTYTTSSAFLTSNAISVVPGDLPCRPAPKTPVAILQDCQYYYEKSYDTNVSPGTATSSCVVISPQYGLFVNITGSTYNTQTNPRTMSINYKTTKRIAITPAIYSPSSTSGNVNTVLYYSNGALYSTDVSITNWTLADSGLNGFAYIPVNRATVTTTSNSVSVPGPVTLATTEAIATFHYVVDARIGVV